MLNNKGWRIFIGIKEENNNCVVTGNKINLKQQDIIKREIIS